MSGARRRRSSAEDAAAPAVDPRSIAAIATEEEEEASGEDDIYSAFGGNTLHMRTSRKQKLMADRLAFTLGVSNIGLSAFIGGRWPEHYWIWHMVKFPLLFAYRTLQYRLHHWHYFLFDFCYVANVLFCVFCTLMPTSRPMFLVCFVFANGPLLWAIPTWRNSLVFHSMDKITSLLIHISPAISLWGLTRHGEGQRFVRIDPETMSLLRDPMGLLGVPLLIYIAWQLMYALKVYILSAQKVEARHYMTSLSTFAADDDSFVNRFGHRYSALVFMAAQLLYTVVTIVMATFLLADVWLHTATILIILLWAVWNGGGYYMMVFSRRYIAELEKQPI